MDTSYCGVIGIRTLKPSECLGLCLSHKQMGLPLAVGAVRMLLLQNEHMEDKLRGKSTKLYMTETHTVKFKVQPHGQKPTLQKMLMRGQLILLSYRVSRSTVKHS